MATHHPLRGSGHGGSPAGPRLVQGTLNPQALLGPELRLGLLGSRGGAHSRTPCGNRGSQRPGAPWPHPPLTLFGA